MIGQTISHYKIIEKLGEGGMGVVYRAEDIKLGRSVALKFLPPHIGTDEENKSRFIQEAKASSAIDHPNIGSIYEIDESPDGYLYIVMACYEGESLKKKIEEGPFPIDSAVDIALQIARGMAKAHERGIIHRDLKPANILITNDGIAKIIDFGLAKLAGGAHLTKTGTTLGTVAYMSPEQARGDDVDAGSDIWSLGVILFEMLTGKLPFRGEFETALMYSIANDDPQPIETFRSSIPFELKLIVARSLQKEPKERYQSMDELIAGLKSLQLKSEINQAAGREAETDWKTATRSIKYIINKNKTLYIWLPGAIVALAVTGFLLKYFLMKPAPTSLSKSIAVLPFVNKGEPEQSYFAEGFTDDINNTLSELPQVLTISRFSTSFFKNSELSDSAIAGRLGVRYLLKGEFQLLIARIKLKLALFDNNSGQEIWNNNYDIARGEIYELKQNILEEIIQQLDIPGDDITTTRPKTTPDVYDSYLHGVHYRDKQNKDDNLLAMTYFSEAIRKDSTYIPAMLALANSKIEQFRQGWDPSLNLLEEGKYYCDKVLRIDSNSSQALAELGIIADIKGNQTEALNLLLRSYDIEKNNAVALTSIAFIYLFEMGEPAKGVMYLKQLQEINPLDWLTALNLGVAYGQIKNYPEALASFRRAHSLNPAHEWPLYSLGYAFERIAQFDSAIFYYNASLQKNPQNPQTYEATASVLLINRKFAAAESILTSGIRYLSDDPQIIYSLGVVYALGNKKSEANRVFSDGLTLIKSKIRKNPDIGDLYAQSALFHSRLGQKTEAVSAMNSAVRLDSTNEEVIMKITRTYAVLGEKNSLLEWFRKAKNMNPEYDAAYLRTALDFEKFRNDPDLISIIRE